MRPVAFGNVVLHLESPEAARYHAPILIVPGLFQSPICWRGFTSMLAHRGWEVYLLPRVSMDMAKATVEAVDKTWQQAEDDLVSAAERLGDKVVIFGADVGAALALATLERVRPMALGLFSPTRPAEMGKALMGAMGFLERRRFNKSSEPLVTAPAAHAKTAYQPSDVIAEPRSFVDALNAHSGPVGPTELPPTIVFGAQNDPLVDTAHSLSFADDKVAKAAKARLTGRWWPSVGWEAASEQAHRFLILTLSDRVVEFPDEILAD
jgi:pimeloyl-ACP methyl ester carboxylesterase